MSRVVQEVELRGFGELVTDAFVYPLRGQGKWLLLVGTVCLRLAGWFTWMPFMGLILALLIGGYLCAYMFRIVDRSARGDRELPDWPDVTDAYDDIVRPFFVVVGTILAIMLPAIVLEVGHLAAGWQTQNAALMAYAAGLFYLPMAMLGVCLTESVLMASPHIVILAVLKVPLEYLLVCAALGLAVALHHYAVPALEGYVPYVGGLAATFLALYCLAFEMRVLGVLYYTRRQRLGWFT
jgi:hypothetical protein